MKIIIISTYIPQKCGIATYSNDLYKSLIKTTTNHTINIIAVTENGSYKYPSEVVATINKESKENYIYQANFINNNYDICILQHEFGIFGGLSGEHIIELTSRLCIPLLTNFHTTLDNPTKKQSYIIDALHKASGTITVMTESAIKLMKKQFNIKDEKMKLIHHGVPIFDIDQKKAKTKLNLPTSKILILSFGFLSKGKGFETAIDAIAKISDLNFLYIILGSTHPNIIKKDGEEYREFLHQRISNLRVDNKILMINKFADNKELKLYLAACDIYITPYPNKNQTSSGTLSFAVGAGAAVISTPYHYAKDLLNHNRGLLFNFNDPTQLAFLIDTLINNPVVLQKYRTNAKTYGKTIQWPIIAKQLLIILQKTIKNNKTCLK